MCATIIFGVDCNLLTIVMNYTKTETFLDNSARRTFLKSSMALAFSLPLGASNFVDDETLLHIVRNGRTYKIPFLRDGKMEANGYYELCKVFEDTHDEVAVQMDPNLFSILAKAQQWLAGNHIYKPIILTSGYRTEHTNKITEGAAVNSMHMYGKAADIHMEGIPIDYLARLLRLCGGAGIGTYPSFVHVDTWKERNWRG